MTESLTAQEMTTHRSALGLDTRRGDWPREKAGSVQTSEPPSFLNWHRNEGEREVGAALIKHFRGVKAQVCFRKACCWERQTRMALTSETRVNSWEGCFLGNFTCVTHP